MAMNQIATKASTYLQQRRLLLSILLKLWTRKTFWEMVGQGMKKLTQKEECCGPRLCLHLMRYAAWIATRQSWNTVSTESKSQRNGRPIPYFMMTYRSILKFCPGGWQEPGPDGLLYKFCHVETPFFLTNSCTHWLWFSWGGYGLPS